MIAEIHKHLLSELDRSGRTDTIFVLASVTFNILVLFTNWAQSGSLSRGHGNFAIFILFMAGAVLISAAALLVLNNNRKVCHECNTALRKIYEDNNVAQYLPNNIGYFGNKRFVISIIVVAGTGILAVLIPYLSIL